MGVRPIRSIRVPAGVPAGVLATVTMDVAMVAAGSLGGSAFTSDRLGPDMIGRWAAGLLRGRWRRGDISREPAQRGELALGLATHYVTGVVAHAGIPAGAASLAWETELPGRDRVRHLDGRAAAPGHVPLDGLRLVRASDPGRPGGSTGSCSSATSRSVSGSGCGRRASRSAGLDRDPLA